MIPDDAPRQHAIVFDPETGEPVGISEMYLCSSAEETHQKWFTQGWASPHPVPAAAIVHWVTGPTLKCALCADALLKIGDALGMHLHVEKIPYPDVDRLIAAHRQQHPRAISLEGVPKETL